MSRALVVPPHAPHAISARTVVVRSARIAVAVLATALSSWAYAQTVTTISVAPGGAVTLPAGVAIQARATATFSDGTLHDVTSLAAWSVSAPGVLEVGAAAGVVRGVGLGEATVTATYGGLTAETAYTIVPATAGTGASRAAFVYAARQDVASGGYSNVLQLDVGPAGALTALPEGVTTTQIRAMRMTADSRYLFVLKWQEGARQTNLQVYRVDAGNGRLTEVTLAIFDGWAGDLAIDPAGRSVYASTVNGPAALRAFRFDDASGTLTQIQTESLSAAALAMDPLRQYLYAFDMWSVWTYRIDGAGTLSQVGSTPIGGMSWVKISAHPSGDFVFVSGNGSFPQVQMYRVTRATGALTAIADPVPLPISATGDTAAQVMTSEIAGDFLYVGSYNDGLRTYAIDPSRGRLYEVAVANPLPKQDVRAIAAEVGGRYVYVAGLDSATYRSTIHEYAIGSDGGLTPVAAYPYAYGGYRFTPIVVANDPPPGVTLASLEVVPADQQVVVSAPEGAQQFHAIGHYSDGTTGFYTSSSSWSSSAPAVATIDDVVSKGRLTITGYGTTTVSAGLAGLSASTTYTVKPVPVVAVALLTPVVTLPQGVSMQFRMTATFGDGTSHDVTSLAAWSVSDPAVLELGTAAGVVRGVGVGQATVTATYAGLTAAAAYTVIPPTAGTGTSRAAFVYAARQDIGSGGSSAVLQLDVDATGGLTAWPDGANTTQIRAMRMTSDSRYLFVLEWHEGDTSTNLFVYRVDAGNGHLTEVTMTAFSGWAGDLAIDPSGRLVYASTINSAVAVHAWRFDDQAGTLTQLQTPSDSSYVVALAVDPQGQYLYASDMWSVRTYRIDASGAPSLVTSTETGGMSWVRITAHPSGNFVYVSGNGSFPQVRMYRVTRATGALTAIADPVPLPISPTGDTAAQVMTSELAGDFLYAGSYNDGLRTYAIDAASGQLYELAVANPLPNQDVRAIAAESGGRYLYVAGLEPGTYRSTLHEYAIGSDGGLTQVAAYPYPSPLYRFTPIVVANAPPPGVTLDGLEVVPADKQVVISAPEGTQQFHLVGHYSDGTTGFYTSSSSWSSSATAVGTVDDTVDKGRLTITGYGTTTVSASLVGLAASTTFTVKPVPVVGLAILTPAVTLPKGVPMQFRVTATFGDGTSHDVTSLAAWSVSDPALLETGAVAGMVRGVGLGQATVTATYGGFTAQASFTVLAPTAATGTSRAAFVYAARQDIGSGGDSAVLQLDVDAEGRLTALPDGVTTTQIRAMRMTADARYLFMLKWHEGDPNTNLYVYRVDAGNGRLTEVAFAILAGWAGDLAIDPSGRLVYASTLNSAVAVRAYRFDDQAGTLTQLQTPSDSSFVTALALDPQGQYLYASDMWTVRTYRIDATGAPSLVSSSATGGMSWVRILPHPSGNFVYVSGNASFPEIEMYRLDRATGALTRIADPVPLPISPTGDTAAQVMTSELAGDFLFAGSYNDGLRTYAIDAASGQLYELAVANPLPQQDVRAIAAESGGRYLYVAGLEPGTYRSTIHEYAIGGDGSLTEVAAYRYPSPLYRFTPLAVASGPAPGVTLASLEVLPANQQVVVSAAGGTQQFQAIGHYSDGTTGFYTASASWSSSAPAVGTIDDVVSKGRLTITGYGTTIVSATLSALAATTTFSAWNAVMSLGGLHQVYDGTPKSVTVSGLPGGMTGLEIRYDGLLQPPTEAGTYTIVAHLDNPWYFAADVSSALVIDRATSATVVACAAGPLTYDGSAQTPCSARVTGAGGFDQAVPVGYASNVGAGTATATATFAGDANHEGSTASSTFVVGKAASTTVVTFEPGPYDYRGTPFTATARVAGAGGLDLPSNVTYGGDCTNVTPTGCTATASYAGDANHEGSADAKQIAIAKTASTTVVSCGAGPFTYSGSAQTPCAATATGTGGLREAVTVAYASNVDAGTATATAQYAGDVNHDASAGSASFTIGKAKATVQVAGYDVLFDGAAHTATGTARGVLGEPLAGLDLGGTTHTAAGTYADTWTFRDVTGNYGDLGGTVTDTIRGAWTMTGFYPPVTMGPLYNTVKGGSTVPLKFNIYEGGVERKDLAAVASFQLASGPCYAGVYEDPLEFVTTGGTSLTYDASAGQFVQKWRTPATAGVCYEVTVTAKDGTRLTALFRTK